MQSYPLRVRGLKLSECDTLKDRLSSYPLRVRGLKRL